MHRARLVSRFRLLDAMHCVPTNVYLMLDTSSNRICASGCYRAGSLPALIDLYIHPHL